MFFKQNMCLATLLLIVVILFSFFSEYRKNVFKSNMREGYTDNKNPPPPSHDEPVPSCSGGGPNNVPGCYNTILDDRSIYGYDSNNSSNHKDDDYILKTQIVPPVCPACPSLCSEGDPNHPPPPPPPEPNNPPPPPPGPNNPPPPPRPNNPPPPPPLSKLSNPLNNLFSSNENINTNLTGGQQSRENYEAQIRSLTNELNMLKQQNAMTQKETCPPCTPCDRCPEPIFSCEKTINYRSPNVGQYLPLPVLNDFSSFGNSQ